MGRKIMALFLSSALLIACTGCGPQEPGVDEDDVFWQAFFGNRTSTEDPDNTEKKLHAQNNYGYWGDLIPYYNQEENRLYMYYMIMLNEYPYEGSGIHLSVSDDMFNFREETYRVYDWVEAAVNIEFRGLGIGIDQIFDWASYPEGPRDWYYFYDTQVERYRYIALAYVSKGTTNRCALVTAVSDDETGLTWSQSCTRLMNFSQGKEPECPCAMWINDRWYIFCSLSSESIHNVGRCRYYIGEKGTGIDQQDWSKKEAHYIDGEDLCATQLIDVGGRYILYGWIPKTYENTYYDGSNDFHLWGGDMSLLREVYQKEDGTLGTRLPEVLKDMLEKEEMDSAENIVVDGQETVISSVETEAVAIRLEADISESDLFKIRLTSDGKTYDVKFINDENSTRISIGCDEDTGHPLYAYYYTDEQLQTLQVMILIEDTVMEVFVNDEYSLTARTSMYTGTVEQISAEATGRATISNFTVHQLANSENIYD